MAISKKIEKANGIQCEYHKISKIVFDIEAKAVICTIKSYINAEMRNKEKRYIELSALIKQKEKKIYLQEIEETDIEYVEAKKEIESISSNTCIETKEYRLELDITVDMQISIATIYNLLKSNHGIFVNAEDI